MLVASASSALSRASEAGHHLGAARRQDLAHAGDAEPLDALALLHGEPGLVGRDLLEQREPVALGELGARSQQRGDGVVAERPERRRVGRVHRVRRAATADPAAASASGNPAISSTEIVRSCAAIARYSSASRLIEAERARIERRQPAAPEVVVDLGLDGRDGGGRGGRSLGTEGKNVRRALFAPGVPGAVGARLGEERVGDRPSMPGFPERSGTVAMLSPISRISARVASSSAAVSVMTPSPLKTVSAKMRAGSPTSSRAISRDVRLCRCRPGSAGPTPAGSSPRGARR